MYKLAIVLALLVVAGAAQAGTVTATANLDYGQNFMPSNPVASTATGTATVVFDDVAGTLDLTAAIVGISVADITFPIGSGLAFDESEIGPFHIHQAAAGANGPPLVFLSDAAFFTDTVEGLAVAANDVSFDVGLLASLQAGELYLNLHTLDYGSGEIRGQLSAVPLPLPLLLLLGPLALLARFTKREL